MKTEPKFLLVDDDIHGALLVEEAFKRTGGHYQLRHLEDALDAEEYLKGKAQYADRSVFPLPDVILLDLKMPGVDGFDFLAWLRHEGPFELRSTPVVVFTSSHEPRDVARAYELGANGYQVKPSKFTVLVDTAKNLVAHWSNVLNESDAVAAEKAEHRELAHV